MPKVISSLSTILTANVSPFVRAFGTTMAPIKSFTSSITGAAGTLLKFTGIGAAVAGVMGVIGSAKDSISLAAELEQNSVAFQTMLGSADAARKMMTDLQGFAASTPFEFPELAKSSKTLLAFGVAGDQILPTLKAIGDVSAATGKDVGELSTIYGKAKASGVLMAEDINQLVDAGVPVFREFAKQLGVSEDQIKGLASQGKLSFSMLQQAFVDLTGKGGQFENMMAAQSQTLGGLWSSLTDNVSMTLAGLVTTIVNAFNLKPALSAMVNGIGTAGGYITAAVTAWAPLIVGWAATVWQTITTTFDAIYASVAPVVASIVKFIGSNFLSLVTTATGYWQSICGLTTTVATGVLAVITAVGTGIVTAWDWAMNALGVSTADTGTGVGDVFATLSSAWQWLVGNLTLGINTLTFGLKNFGTVVAFVLVSAAYQAVAFGNQIADVFTNVIPATVTWFASNFTAILTDMASFYDTVLTNMLANAVNFGKALWSAIKGDGFDFEFTGLTEGFKASLTELPKIADRQIGVLEQSLGDQSKTLGDALAVGLSDSLTKADGDAKAGAKGVIDSLGSAVAGMPQIKPPDIATPTLDPLKIDANTKATDKMAKGMDKVKDSAKEAADALKLTTAGSAEAMAARAGGAADAMLADARKSHGTADAATSGTVADTVVAVSKPPDVRQYAKRADGSNLMEQVVLLIQSIKAEAVKIAKNTDGPLAEVAL